MSGLTRRNLVKEQQGIDMAAPRGPRENPFRRVVRHFESSIGAGLLVILPLIITIWVIQFLFDLFDPIFQELFLQYLPGPRIPGLGVLVMLALIYLAGWFTTHGLGQRLINYGHRGLEFLPVVKAIYGPLRSAVQLMGSAEDRPYRGVVLVEFPRAGAKSIGLITSQLGDLEGEEMVAVYVPTTPVPSSGFLIVVPAKDVISTDFSVDDAMKIIISGGILAGSIMGDPVTRQPPLREQDHD